ncbi:EAL domain-containing protein [Nostoc flagelliforme FACHB-838]|uniref:EAL domain-containing protein n=1 Tax=Nostoc flagelliforme FACHB-838 TaxID=2692904 RepID=A0ABR8DZI6_9NOSO|nr:EAL domain-containing protein [Nostoc flagelliforme FACHB-838]
MAARICGTPIALIGFIDNTRQWFKSRVGWEALEISSDISFCAHTIKQTGLFVIQDVLADERFATNPLVIFAPHIRFYAGMPLITTEGYTLGTLCVMDCVPRELNFEQKEALQVLSRQVVSQIELKRSLVERQRLEEALQKANQEIEIRVEERTTELRNAFERSQGEIVERQRLETQLRRREQELADFFENGAIGLHRVGADGSILWANQAELDLLGYSREEYIGQHIANFHADQEVIDDILQKLAAKETLNDYEARLLCKDGSIKYVLIDSNVFWEDGQFIHTRCFTRDITECKQAEEALKIREYQQAVVAQLGQFVLTNVELSTLMNEAIMWVAQSLEVEYSNVLELLPDGNALRLIAGVGWQAGLVGQETVGAEPDSQAGYTLLFREPVIVEDLRTEKRFSGPPLLHEHGVVSSLSITIEGQNCPFGILGAHTARRRTFTEDDVNFLQSVANILATAIERKRAEELLLERARLAALEADIGIALTRSDSLPDILQQCVQALVRHLDAAFARIWTLNAEENVLELQASAGMYTHINGSHSRVPVGQFKIGLIAQSRQPHLTNNVIGDRRVHDQEWAAQEGMVAFAGYPLIVEEQVVGVVAIFARHLLTEDTLKAMASVANGLALGIQRKRGEEALRESERRLQAILDSSTAVIYLMDAENRYILVNRQYEELFHTTQAQIAGRSLYENWPQEVADTFAVNNQRVLETRKALEFEEVVPQDDGLHTYLTIKVPVCDASGTPYAICGVSTDITERKQAEQALQKARDYLEIRVQERTAELTKINEELQSEITERKRVEEALKRRKQEIKTLVEHAPDIIARFSTQLRYVYINPAIEQATGIAPQAFIGKTNAELGMPSELCQIWGQKLQQVFETKQEVVFEFSFPTSSETIYYQARYVPEFASDGSVESVLSIARNITALKQAQEKLIHDAFHDALTGLPNRTLFVERLECALKHTKRRADYSVAVLFLDLDRFKLVNDSLGHTIGDQLLMALADRLKKCLRSGDTVARLGGDEFTILLDDIKGMGEVTYIVDRIHEELRLPFNLSGYEVFTTVSIGIALTANSYELAEEILRDADTAMYRAKTLGKARSEVFGKDMHARAVARLQLEMDLRRAIERQEFRLYYQPIIFLETGNIHGFEALVRWQHPDRGLVSPAEFIPVAEETGLILPIGQWVLREACRQMHMWQEQFSNNSSLTISVNLSRKQFTQPNLVEQIEQILQETKLKPRDLSLEITESIVMENAETATSMLMSLGALGMQLHMDDFGTGYSSLSYLHRFPLNTLKIDRSFIKRIGDDVENLEIVQAIVTLAHSLGMEVTAEGVETAEQLAQLKVLKCEYVQGYFFSKPINSEMAKALIAKEPQLYKK